MIPLALPAASQLVLMAALAVPPVPTVPLDTYPKNPTIDALHYAFRLELSDTTDAITGTLAMDVRFLQPGVQAVRLDLVNAGGAAAGGAGGKGMRVARVRWNGTEVPYRHANDELLIPLPTPSVAQQRVRVEVEYGGVPATGLLIGRNKHGDRTVFSDNWPNRARHWLPTIDHPYDKATSEFIVTAPSHYQVVSNGLQVEVTDLPGGRRRTHWRNGVPIAPWLYVLGVARFAMQRVDTFEGKPIETWVYPQDRDAGFADFATPTKQVLAFYSDYVGPYAYERLANIQASSVAGGMESASAILYNESAVTGTRSVRWRNVVIHEIAHQWFGNAVTEADWDDVWLSEGFATYFTLLFIEHAYGRDEFVRGLEGSRQTVRAFAEKNPGYTIVHRNLRRMEDVTSSHTYQKGSWILHMLRGVVGDEAFQRGIRSYYQRHFNGNATTADFRRAMEEAAGRELGWFFDQWLYKPGTLKVAGQWRYNAAARQLELQLDQVQTDGSLFTMPLEVGVRAKGQAVETRHRVQLTGKSNRFTIDLPAEPESVRLDPGVWVLMDATLERGR
jgi:aminopeptidase N